MNSLNPYNFVLLFVVIVFWGAALLLSRVRQRNASPGLLIVPLFFILLGVSINRYYPGWGTIVVAIIHVMMLPALLRAAKSRP
jgi:hypothetical protein